MMTSFDFTNLCIDSLTIVVSDYHEIKNCQQSMSSSEQMTLFPEKTLHNLYPVIENIFYLTHLNPKSELLP